VAKIYHSCGPVSDNLKRGGIHNYHEQNGIYQAKYYFINNFINFAKFKFMVAGYFVAKQALAGLQIIAVRLEYPVAFERKGDRRLMQC